MLNYCIIELLQHLYLKKEEIFQAYFTKAVLGLQQIKRIYDYFRQPIKCGQTIRLMHLSTRRNLHSHHFQSPLSHNLEVSAFGEDGEGDEGR